MNTTATTQRQKIELNVQFSKFTFQIFMAQLYQNHFRIGIIQRCIEKKGSSMRCQVGKQHLLFTYGYYILCDGCYFLSYRFNLVYVANCFLPYRYDSLSYQYNNLCDAYYFLCIIQNSFCCAFNMLCHGYNLFFIVIIHSV